MRTFSLPYPFGPRRGAAAAVDARTTTPGLVAVLGRDDPAGQVPNRPGPRSPLAMPLHPYLARSMGLALDARALVQLEAHPKPAPRVTLSVGEQERQRGLRAVTTRLRTPPRSYATWYNAAPLGRAGTATARPLPGMDTLPPGDLPSPCVGCR